MKEFIFYNNPFEACEYLDDYYKIVNINGNLLKIPLITKRSTIIVKGMELVPLKKLIVNKEKIMEELKKIFSKNISEECLGYIIDREIFNNKNIKIEEEKYICEFEIIEKEENKDKIILSINSQYFKEINNKIKSIQKEIKARNLDYYILMEKVKLKEFLNLERIKKKEKFFSTYFVDRILRNFQNFNIVDCTNSLSEVESLRKVSFVGSSYSPKETRDLHESFKGKICCIETPESEKIGLILHLSKNSNFKIFNDKSFRIENPTYEDILGYGALQVPFISYNDPTRVLMASKNLKQAVPLKEPEPPLIKTGYEKEILDVVKNSIFSPFDGIIQKVKDTEIIIETEDKIEKIDLPQYPDITSKVLVKFKPIVSKDEKISKGDKLAVRLDFVDGVLSLGKNLLVFYMPYYGYNMDDAIVISKSAAKKLTSLHCKIIEKTLNDTVKVTGKILREFRNDLENKVVYWIYEENELTVGDKLMGRHGNKGVVSKILDDDKMPYAIINGKKIHAEIILNPHGIISRMNIGQVLETHWGWVAKMHPDENVRKEAEISGKPFKTTDFQKLSKYLKDTGLNENGQAIVYIPETGAKTDFPVTIGYQYIVKLNHLSKHKLHIRSSGKSYSITTGLPLKGKKKNGGQRIGEMETWAFIAQNCDNVLNYLFHKQAFKRDEDSKYSNPLLALIYYLHILGYHLKFYEEEDSFFELNKNEILEKSIKFLSCVKFEDNIEKAKEILGNFSYSEISDKNKIKSLPDSKLFNKENIDESYFFTFNTIEKNTLNSHFLPIIPLRYRPHENSPINKCYKNIAKGYGRKKHYQRLKDEAEKIISSKTGLIRGTLLGRRIDYSGRAVIVPNPEIPFDTVILPNEFFKKFNITQGEYVLLNRQPTLHMHNIQGFKAKKTSNYAISINPLICGGYNADFDGDTMAVYFVKDKFYKEQSKVMSAYNHIFLAANGGLNLHLEQDIVSGLFYGSVFKKEELENKLKEIGFEFTENWLNKDKVKKMVKDYFVSNNIGTYKEKREFIKKVEALAKLGFKYSTESGLSFSIFELLEINRRLKNKISKEKKDADEIEKEIKKILEEQIHSEKFNSFGIMAVSKARGSFQQIRQMSFYKGKVPSISGKKLPVITKGYIESLTVDEFFIASHGARQGLGDKKLTTPECGYLTRRLIYSACDIYISEEDCKTKDYVEYEKDYFDGLIGRVLAEDIGDIKKGEVITEKVLEEIKNFNIEKVKVYTPLKCRAQNGVCQKCYGWQLNLRDFPEIETNVGIISAQSIGERATQDAMKTFHQAEQSGSIQGFEDIKRLFDGRIEDIKKNDFIQDLFKLYEKKVSLIHYEIMAKALFENDELIGTFKKIEKSNGLVPFYFSNPLKFLKNLDEDEKIELSDVFSKIIFEVN